MPHPMISIAFFALVLVALDAALWQRTCRLRRDLRATQQEVKAQRLAMDEPEIPPRRRLRGLALFV